MLAQPQFGWHLKRLRLRQGLSQAALAGSGMSTGYLSRLESGVRPPTDTAIAYLAGQLKVDISALMQAPSNPLGQVLAEAMSTTPATDTAAAVRAALADDEGRDPLSRWQALWLLTDGNHSDAETVRDFEELTALSDEIGLPTLQVRSRVRQAVRHRADGHPHQAMPLAQEAVALCADHDLATADTADALITQISLEAELEMTEQASTHIATLDGLRDRMPDSLQAKALWTASVVSVRRGDFDDALSRLRTALERVSSATDIGLWIRLRLAASSVALQTAPPSTESAAVWLHETAQAIALVGPPGRADELALLRALLAFAENRFEEARRLTDDLIGRDAALSYRDGVQLRVLDGRLMIVEGRVVSGVATLRAIGQEVSASRNVALAAQVWQALALSLADASVPPH